MKNTIVITGGAGFVGVNLAQKLVNANYKVEIWDIDDYLKRLEYSDLRNKTEIKFRKVDLSITVPEIDYKNIAGIYHLAALPHVDYSQYKPIKVIRNNIDSLLNILDLSLKQDIPIIFASSVEVYGGTQCCVYMETDTPHPISPYAASKAACENVLNSFIKSFGLKAKIVRFTNLYGPWQSPDRLVSRIIAQAISNINCQIEIGKIRDFLYISDACEALIKLLNINTWGETFNLSSGHGYDNEFIGKLIKLQDDFSSEFDFIPNQANDGRGRSLVASPAKLEKTLDWKKKVSIEQGIKITFDWYKMNKVWWRQFDKNLNSARDNKHFIIDSLYWEKEMNTYQSSIWANN